MTTTATAQDSRNTTAKPITPKSERNFVIRYNPNAEGHIPALLRGTVSDIQAAGCDVSLDDSRRYGSFYNLKAPWLGENFRVDDLGTAGTIAIDLCEDGTLGSGPA